MESESSGVAARWRVRGLRQVLATAATVYSWDVVARCCVSFSNRPPHLCARPRVATCGPRDAAFAGMLLQLEKIKFQAVSARPQAQQHDAAHKLPPPPVHPFPRAGPPCNATVLPPLVVACLRAPDVRLPVFRWQPPHANCSQTKTDMTVHMNTREAASYASKTREIGQHLGDAQDRAARVPQTPGRAALVRGGAAFT